MKTMFENTNFDNAISQVKESLEKAKEDKIITETRLTQAKEDYNQALEALKFYTGTTDINTIKADINNSEAVILDITNALSGIFNKMSTDGYEFTPQDLQDVKDIADRYNIQVDSQGE